VLVSRRLRAVHLDQAGRGHYRQSTRETPDDFYKEWNFNYVILAGPTPSLTNEISDGLTIGEMVSNTLSDNLSIHVQRERLREDHSIPLPRA
jgi:hypothetical protein